MKASCFEGDGFLVLVGLPLIAEGGAKSSVLDLVVLGIATEFGHCVWRQNNIGQSLMSRQHM